MDKAILINLVEAYSSEKKRSLDSNLVETDILKKKLKKNSFDSITKKFKFYSFS